MVELTAQIDLFNCPASPEAQNRRDHERFTAKAIKVALFTFPSTQKKNTEEDISKIKLNKSVVN